MATRDLSVIATPPPNRYPIQSEVTRFNETRFEMAFSMSYKGGQVYFVHNRVESIQEVAVMIQRLVPDAALELATGK